MASAALRAELECSVCLSIYTDPVMLRCGHNFCRDCISRVLNTQKRSGSYSCPACREEFQAWPALQRNITLRNIVENFLPAQPDQESGIFCTYCIHTPVPAVRSCLMCEASLCDDHLRVHSKAPEHVLCDPTTSLESRKCSVHKKILEYYCTDDYACICVSCSLAGEHRGHQVETLDEASEMKKKKLRNVLQKLMTEREETEKRVQSLQERRIKVQGKAADETEKVTVLIRDIKRQLEDLEKRVLSDISGQAEQVSLSLDDLIQNLELKKDELSKKMGDIEELCNMTDPLTVLQQSATGDLCDTEDGDDEESATGDLYYTEDEDDERHDGWDLDVAAISHTLHTGLSDIMLGVNVQECPGTRVYPQSSTKKKAHTKLSRPHHHHTPTVQRSHLQAGGPNIGPARQTLGVSGVTDILLNVSTAANNLHISYDRKTASWSSHQNRPETPGRFECDQVLSSQSFSSGHHYWEVDVGGSDWWRVGMSYPSIKRRGKQSVIGNNRKSWCLERWGSKQYSVIHDSNKIRLSDNVSGKDGRGEQPSLGYNKKWWDLERWSDYQYSVKHDSNEFRSPYNVFSDEWVGYGREMFYPRIGRREDQPSLGYNKKSWGLEAWGGNQYSVRHDRKEPPSTGKVSRVRVDVDYEAGRISFYDVCDPIRHLHTFTATFTEPLHAGIYVGEGCIKISEGNHM